MGRKHEAALLKRVTEEFLADETLSTKERLAYLRVAEKLSASISRHKKGVRVAKEKLTTKPVENEFA